jgi:hypothetical protein
MAYKGPSLSEINDIDELMNIINKNAGGSNTDHKNKKLKKKDKK